MNFDYDVAIVGAGIAGLTAAAHIHNQNKSTIVLEARNRIGGRIFTHRTFSSAISVELGAELIHGSNSTAYNLAIQKNIPLTAVDYLSNNQEKERNPYGFLPPALLEENLSSYLVRTGCSLNNIPSVMQYWINDYGPPHQLDANTIINTHNQIILDISNNHHSDTKNIKDNIICPSAYQNFLTCGGYDQLLAIPGKEENLKLDAQVTEIEWNAKQVTLTYLKNNKINKVCARKCLITVPLSLLQKSSIKFTPELPAQLLRAIHQIGYARALKIIFKFPHPIFSSFSSFSSLSSASNAPYKACILEDSTSSPSEWWQTGTQENGETIMTGWAAGDHADLLLAMSETSRFNYSLEQLKKRLSNFTLTPVAAISYDWQADPFSLGAYSFPKAGMPCTAQQDISKPLAETVFWAGEAYSAENFASVSGAYDTAKEAAQQILSSFN